MADTILSQGTGYGIVLGMGLAFAAAMLCITWIQQRYTSYSVKSSEELSSASHALKPAFIASGIVSGATWASTLLQASTVGYVMGISAPYWYGAGSASQIMIFAQNAAKLKQHAPNCHTFLEFIYVRWGAVPHIIFMFFGLGASTCLSSQLILGGSAVVSALTGMNILAACFLIPLPVVVFTVFGGLRATFLADWSHTMLIYAIILAFSFTLFSHADGPLGSPRAVYDALTEAAAAFPVAGNAEGSYLTFRSTQGLVFGIIVIVSGISTVQCDQVYWQRAVASQPQTAVTGYILGGLSFLPIPWLFGTCAGVGAVALASGANAVIAPLAGADIGAGLAAPTAAIALLGRSGAILLLLVLFLAVTSAASAELVAVSSILTYDVYRTYFNKNATEAQMVRATHICVIGFGIFLGVLGLIFHFIGINLSWLYGFTGTAFGSAVIPIALCLRVHWANRQACIAGAVVGFLGAMAAWFLTAWKVFGEVSVATTGQTYPQLAGNLGGLIVSGLVCFIWSLLSPENYDFAEMRAKTFRPADAIVLGHGPVHVGGAGQLTPGLVEDEKKVAASSDSTPASLERRPSTDDLDQAELQKAFVASVWATLSVFVLLCIFIPAVACAVPVWSMAGLAAWIAIAIALVFVAIFITVILPVVESRHGLMEVVGGIMADVRGKGRA